MFVLGAATGLGWPLEMGLNGRFQMPSDSRTLWALLLSCSRAGLTACWMLESIRSANESTLSNSKNKWTNLVTTKFRQSTRKIFFFQRRSANVTENGIRPLFWPQSYRRWSEFRPHYSLTSYLYRILYSERWIFPFSQLRRPENNTRKTHPWMSWFMARYEGRTEKEARKGENHLPSHTHTYTLLPSPSIRFSGRVNDLWL